MEISPTLGISNQYNPGPMEQYAAIASQGLQQLGAQVQQDITTIQTNQQLKNFAQQLQGINPTAVQKPVTDSNGNTVYDAQGNPQMQFDPSFASQMTQAITSNPLAAHSPVGMQAINELGQQHQAAIQGAMLNSRLGNQFGIASLRAQTSADNNANSGDVKERIAEGNQDLGYYKTDQGNAAKYGLQANSFDNQQQLQSARLQSAADLQDAGAQYRQELEDRKEAANANKVPPSYVNNLDKSWKDLNEASANHQANLSRLQSSPDDANLKAQAAGSQTALNGARARFNSDQAAVQSFRGGKVSQPGAPQPPAINGFGMPSGPSPAQPGALMPSDVIAPVPSGAPQASQEKVQIRDSKGGVYRIPKSNLAAALSRDPGAQVIQ